MTAAHLQEAGHHGMREHDRLELALRHALVAVLPRQHVDLPLVHAQLADVRLRHHKVRTVPSPQLHLTALPPSALVVVWTCRIRSRPLPCEGTAGGRSMAASRTFRKKMSAHCMQG